MSDQPDPSRLTRLEESLAYADRAAEEAGRQILDLYRRLDALSRRLEAIEKRLEEDTRQPEPGTPRRITDEELRANKPPHSA
ncbi:MAG: SlyX family protein [Phycisphaeraceae bacterium]|nr:SlyX family protein [Phycisphaeraceae bacterium]MBX3366346.1 SlyX family protein [Phycisphaeraceae bacterium]QYK48802.1 MAG: SlyX family protein [Phycisphaeraceae bacterium]